MIVIVLCLPLKQVDSRPMAPSLEYLALVLGLGIVAGDVGTQVAGYAHASWRTPLGEHHLVAPKESTKERMLLPTK
jgi:hypothetical protein